MGQVSWGRFGRQRTRPITHIWGSSRLPTAARFGDLGRLRRGGYCRNRVGIVWPLVEASPWNASSRAVDPQMSMSLRLRLQPARGGRHGARTGRQGYRCCRSDKEATIFEGKCSTTKSSEISRRKEGQVRTRKDLS